jgi:transposase-like protein
MRTEVARDIRESFTARSEEDAQRLLDLGTEKYEKKASTLVAWMIDNIPDGFGVFKLSRSHRRRMSTNKWRGKPEQATQTT